MKFNIDASKSRDDDEADSIAVMGSPFVTSKAVMASSFVSCSNLKSFCSVLGFFFVVPESFIAI